MTLPAALTPKWERPAKQAIRRQIQAERDALATLRTASRDVVATLIARLAIMPHARDRREAVRIAMREVSRAMAPMRDAMAHATYAGRLGAKDAGFTSLLNDWDMVRAEVMRLGDADPGSLPRAPASERDRLAADAAGASYSAAWAASVMGSLMSWSAKAESTQQPAITLPVVTIVAASKAVDYRVRRIAATETVRAFADEAGDVRHEVAKLHRERNWYAALLKVWSAYADACTHCQSLNGQVRPWGIGFTGGAEPGYVHPLCRCIEMTLFLPTLIESERAAA